ncbi:MAG: hypothetical protein IKL76_03485 [Clostridia bacterium]|nr:hypothetical protein [Clostridia bacterium]
MAHRGRIYRSIVICIVTVLLAVALLPNAFYGAKVVKDNVTGHVTFIPDTDKLISDLEDAGLYLVQKEDGSNEFIAESSSGSTVENWFFASSAHNKLVEYGILSYEMYTYTPESCTTMADLTIILDFSGYAVTSFRDQSIMTLRSALTGNAFGALTPTATVYNQDGTTGKANLRLRGGSGMQATLSSGTVALNSYALRLVFAGGYGDIELGAESIAFVPSFMDLPIAMEFDLRHFTANDRLIIADGASNYNNTQGTNHLHFLCNDESQLKYTVGSQAWEIKKYLFKDNIYKKL